MNRETVRLELLKMCYRGTGGSDAAANAVAQARQLEAYCYEPGEEKNQKEPTPALPPKEAPVTHKGQKKKGDNSIFS